MRFTEHRYKMMYYMLTHADFAQRELADHLGIEFGNIVNSFVKALVDLGYVAKTGTVKQGGRKYQVVSPVGLISFYSTFRKMKKLDTFVIGYDRNEVIEYLAKHKAIFCLTTALSQYSTYYVDPAIYAYLPKDKQHILEDELKNKEKGKIVINLYDYDIEDEVTIIDNKKITSKVRTIIDLYCDNKGHVVEELVKELW